MTKTGPPGSFDQPPIASIIGGVPPDIVYTDGHRVQQWHLSQKLFIPISDVVPTAALATSNWIHTAKRTFLIIPNG